MAICDVCGNDYDKSFEIRRGPVTYTFDCFECAIHRLAPQCAHCALPHHWTWCGERGTDLLLCQLRA